MIHLVCGPIGAGKTTYAQKISTSLGAVCFSEDEWLNALFVPDAPDGLLTQPMDVVGAWASEKYVRCRERIWHVSQLLLEKGLPIIIDGAAANREQREVVRKRASDSAVGFQLHYVTCDAKTREIRVFNRNEVKGETYSLEVTLDMFHHMESAFEPPVDEELEGAVVIDNSLHGEEPCC